MKRAAASRADRIVVWISLVALFLICLGWLRSGSVIAQIDFPPPVDGWNGLAKCLLPWNHFRSTFGQLDPCFSFAPYFAVEGALQHIAGNSLAEIVLFAAPLLFGWLGVYRCVRAFGPSSYACALAAWAYTLNPFRQFSVGLWVTAELFAAIFPWIVLAMIRAATEPVARRPAMLTIAALSFSLIGMMGSNPQLLVALAVGATAWFCALLALSNEKSDLAHWGLVTFFASALASLWWSLPLVLAFLSEPLTRSVDPSLNAWTFVRASLLNELRLNPSWVWQYTFYYPYNLLLDHNVVLYASGFLLAIGLACALILGSGRLLRLARFAGVIALIMLFVAKGVHPPLAGVNVLLYKVPGMAAFLEVGGAVIVAAFSLIIVLAIAWEALWATLRSSRLRALVPWAAGVIALLAVAPGLTIVTGAVFHEADDGLPAMHVRIPPSWLAVARRLNSGPSDGAVLVMPSNPNYQTNYRWGFRGSDLMPHYLIHRQVQLLGVPSSYLSDPRADASLAIVQSALSSSNPAAALHDFGFRYVLFRGDIDAEQGFAPSPDPRLRNLGVAPQQFGPLSLYDIGPPAAEVVAFRGDQLRMVAASDYPLASRGSPPAAAASDTASFAARVQRAAPWPAGIPLPLVVSKVPRYDGIVYDVFNPSSWRVRTGIAVGVPARFAATYLLIGKHSYSASLPASSHILFARFANVRLESGHNSFQLSSSGSAALALTPLLPPRSVDSKYAALRTENLTFSKVTPTSGARGGSLRTAAVLDVAASRHPSVTLEGPIPDEAPNDAIVSMRYRGNQYDCYVPLRRRVAVPLPEWVSKCFASSGIAVSEDDARLLSIQRIGFAKSSARQIEVTIDKPHGHAVKPYFPLPAGIAVPIVWRSEGIVVARTPANFSGLLTLRDLYAPAWFGLAFTPRPVTLEHLETGRWRNAWRAPGGGLVIFASWLSIWEILAFAVALISLFAIAARLRR